MSINAADVKEALRARHPAVIRNGSASWAGAWTCLEEWSNIDLLAVSAWATVRPYPRYARIGYEVKVSRSDYRRELAKPRKRAAAVAFTHEFYFAIPRGLLKPEELAWTPPWGFDQEWAPFERVRCPGAYGYSCLNGRVRRFSRFPADRQRASAYSRSTDYANDRRVNAECPTCWGKGWIAEAPVVRAGAPKLWIPDDVGLVLVEESGRTIIAKRAPRRTPGMRAASLALAGAIASQSSIDGIVFSDADLANLVRWVSVRPDARHAGLRDDGTPPPEGVSSSH